MVGVATAFNFCITFFARKVFFCALEFFRHSVLRCGERDAHSYVHIPFHWFVHPVAASSVRCETSAIAALVSLVAVSISFGGMPSWYPAKLSQRTKLRSSCSTAQVTGQRTLSVISTSLLGRTIRVGLLPKQVK